MNKIFEKHYDELKFNNASRKDAYYNYCGQNFKTTGNGSPLKNNLNELHSLDWYHKDFLATLLVGWEKPSN